MERLTMQTLTCPDRKGYPMPCFPTPPRFTLWQPVLLTQPKPNQDEDEDNPDWEPEMEQVTALISGIYLNPQDHSWYYTLYYPQRPYDYLPDHWWEYQHTPESELNPVTW